MGDRQQKQQQRRRTQRQVQQRRQPLNLAGSTKGASPGAEEHIESTRSKRVDRGSCERGAVVHVRPCSASSAPSASGATRAAGRDPSEDAAHCAHGAADGAAPSPPSAGPTPTAWVFICVSWGRPRITPQREIGRFLYLETSREGRPQASPRAQVKNWLSFGGQRERTQPALSFLPVS